MTPFDAALSRLRDAAASSTCAAALSPASAALRTRRTAVFSADLTDLLRRRAASLVRMRLIWDLILATPDCLRFVGEVNPVMPRRTRRTRSSRLPAGRVAAQIRGGAGGASNRRRTAAGGECVL